MSLRPFAVVTLTLLALAACSTDAPGTDRSSGASSSSDVATDPAEALGRAGLALPSGATAASLDVVEVEDADTPGLLSGGAELAWPVWTSTISTGMRPGLARRWVQPSGR